MKMNKRQIKKMQKKNGTYIPPEDTWSLDYTIAKFVLPRLKRFRNETNGYPAHDEADTFEHWQAVLDEMIEGFESKIILSDNDWWIDNPEYDYFKLYEKLRPEYEDILSNDEDVNNYFRNIRKIPEVEAMRQKMDAKELELQQKWEHGLQLFAKWFDDLWW